MFDLFQKKQKFYNAKLIQNGKEFTVNKGINLLAAALDQGIEWPHKCRVGSCGSCKYRLIKGKISPDIDFGYVLNIDELKDGYALACQTSLRSDVEVEIDLKK